MFNLKWSPAEKKIARKAYERARDAALSKILVQFKERAAVAASVTDMWAMEHWLREQRKDLDEMLDDRYSQLPLVFAWAIRAGHIDQEQLAGLSDDKLTLILGLLRPMKG